MFIHLGKVSNQINIFTTRRNANTFYESEFDAVTVINWDATMRGMPSWIPIKKHFESKHFALERNPLPDQFPCDPLSYQRVNG